MECIGIRIKEMLVVVALLLSNVLAVDEETKARLWRTQMSSRVAYEYLAAEREGDNIKIGTLLSRALKKKSKAYMDPFAKNFKYEEVVSRITTPGDGYAIVDILTDKGGVLIVVVKEGEEWKVGYCSRGIHASVSNMLLGELFVEGNLPLTPASTPEQGAESQRAK